MSSSERLQLKTLCDKSKGLRIEIHNVFKRKKKNQITFLGDTKDTRNNKLRINGIGNKKY